MKRIIPLIFIAGCAGPQPLPVDPRPFTVNCETPVRAPVEGPDVSPAPGPSPDKPSPDVDKPKPDAKPSKPKGNASGNNGRGGNYSRSGHADNGKGRGKGRR